MNETPFLYTPAVLDLVRVATEYCKYLEQTEEAEADDFVRVMRSLLPMIYLKATLAGDVPESEGWTEQQVTEDDYNYIRARVAALLGPNDDFLDTFVEDFRYSDQPVLCTVSEALADVYQQLRELAAAYRDGCEDVMLSVLGETMDEFRLQWGQKLLGALRALHEISCKQ